MWQIINSEAKDAQELMDLDQFFLDTLVQPTLHFYRFKDPSLTYGLLMKPKEHLNLEALSAQGITLAKRPTGGGALFHLWDLAFSVIIPLKAIPHITHTLDRYGLINELTEEALRPFCPQEFKKEFLDKTPEGFVGERFCMAKPTQYDLMVEGKKWVGAAQRVTRNTLLHQATIALCAPDMSLLKEVLLDQEVVSKMEAQSFFIAPFSYQEKKPLSELQTEIEESLRSVFNKRYQDIFEK
jgi:lipoate-protein ligase A